MGGSPPPFPPRQVAPPTAQPGCPAAASGQGGRVWSARTEVSERPARCLQSPKTPCCFCHRAQTALPLLPLLPAHLGLSLTVAEDSAQVSPPSAPHSSPLPTPHVPSILASILHHIP